MTKKIKKKSNQKEIKSETANCKNCETRFVGKYCPNCSQSVYEFETPFKILIIDFLGNIFAFDTRFWKSLVSLIVRPGKYTADYLKGHRAKYMPPFQFYIFISFIFFLLSTSYLKKNVLANENKRHEINSSINAQLNSNTRETDSLNTKEHSIVYDDSIKVSGTAKELIVLQKIVNNPGMYIDNFLKILSRLLFLLMPVYAFYSWLFFQKSRKYYYSHLIFAINQHAYIFLLFILLLGLKLLFPNRDYNPENYILWLIPIYFYFGNLQLFKRSWHSTLLRSFSVLFLYVSTLAIVFGVVLVFWLNDEFL